MFVFMNNNFKCLRFSHRDRVTTLSSTKEEKRLLDMTNCLKSSSTVKR